MCKYYRVIPGDEIMSVIQVYLVSNSAIITVIAAT